MPGVTAPPERRIEMPDDVSNPPMQTGSCPFCERAVLVYEDPPRCPLCACPLDEEGMTPFLFPGERTTDPAD